MSKRDDIAEEFPEALCLSGEEYDKCILGILECYGLEPRIVYDKQCVIKVLQEHHGMTLDEAVEWYEYNMLGAYVGENTPAYLSLEERA